MRWTRHRTAQRLKEEGNGLLDKKGIVLHRVAQNLRYLIKAKMHLKGEIHNTLAAAYNIDATAYDIDDVNDTMDC